MSWIRLETGIGANPKVAKFARLLGLSKVEAIGHLVLLWTWAADQVESGDLSSQDEVDIISSSGWAKRRGAEKFILALQDSGLMDGKKLHDWEHYQGALIERRRRDREYAKARRASSDNRTTVTVPVDRQSLTRTNVTNVTNEQTKERGADAPTLSQPFSVPTAGEVQAYLDELGEARFTGEAFVDFYQARGWKFPDDSPMEDWKSAVRTWRRRENTPAPEPEDLQMMATFAALRAEMTDD